MRQLRKKTQKYLKIVTGFAIYEPSCINSCSQHRCFIQYLDGVKFVLLVALLYMKILEITWDSCSGEANVFTKILTITEVSQRESKPGANTSVPREKQEKAS